MITYTKQPHPREHRLIFKNVDRTGWDPSIACALRDGAYEDLKKALAMKPQDITEEVKKSGLRGRGGAGFPTGMKWTFIPPNNTKPVYLICNGDESEPGTFKDRYILHQDPHQLIEGMVISAYAVGAHTAYIYLREEFPAAARIVEQAIDDARKHNFVGINVLGSGFDVEIHVHRGAGAYICGEETGLIESLEGKRPYPRIKPPYFPAALGLYQCPTIVNNVESLCHVKHIIRMGGDAYARLGVARNTGTRIVCVSGDVKKPGYFEIEVGKLTMRELLYNLCGGPKDGRKFKAVIPGGSSSKILRCDESFIIKNPTDGSERQLAFWDIPLDFDTIAACGSMAGSGGVIVIDDSRKMSWVLNNLNAFYAHESCGQCTPCREGTPWMKKISDRIVAGTASPRDLDTLESVAYQIDGRTVCAFGEASSWPVEAIIAKFRDELLADTRPDNDAQCHNPEEAAQRRYLSNCSGGLDSAQRRYPETARGGGLDLQLFEAVKGGYADQTEDLIVGGANVNAVDEEGNTPLYYAADRKFNSSLVLARLMVKYGAIVDAGCSDGWTPLHLAARQGATGMIEFLLDNGANINKQNIHGWTPLHFAARNNEQSAAVFLVERNASKTIRCNDGMTPADMADNWGFMTLYKYLK